MSDETTKKELYSVDTNTMLWETWHLEELDVTFLFITNKPFDIHYHLEGKE